MKCIFGLLAVALCVIYVNCESCTTNTNCVTTSCSTGAEVICQHPDSGGITEDGGLCTCASIDGEECTAREDCYMPAYPELDCEDSSRHCYDNECICSRWPIRQVE